MRVLHHCLLGCLPQRSFSHRLTKVAHLYSVCCLLFVVCYLFFVVFCFGKGENPIFWYCLWRLASGAVQFIPSLALCLSDSISFGLFAMCDPCLVFCVLRRFLLCDLWLVVVKFVCDLWLVVVTFCLCDLRENAGIALTPA
jgi:hypothetical protein